MLDDSLAERFQGPPRSTFDGDGLTFRASDMDAGACANTLRARGTSLMRGVFPPHLLPPMIDDIERYFRWLAKGERAEEVALYTSYGNIFFATVADFGKRTLMDVHKYMTQGPASEAMHAYFRTDRIALFLGYSFIRRHWRTDTKSISPFHQDSVAVPVPAPMLTCWIPLSPCGVHAPGLEVVAERLDSALPITDVPATNHAPMEIDASVVERHFGDRLWHPEFGAGDVMMFDSMCVHRTHVTPTMTGVRHSIELRFVDVLRAPPAWLEGQGELLITIPHG